MVGTSGGLLLYSVANYLTLAVAARGLDGHGFGLFAAYYALLGLLLVPASVLRISMVQARATGTGVPVGASIGLVLAISVAAGLIAAGSAVADDPAPLTNGALIVLGTVLAATGWLGRGALQARERYGRYSLGLAAESVSRLLLLALLGWFGGTPTQVLLAIVVSRAIGHVGIDLRAVREAAQAAGPWAAWACRDYAPLVMGNVLTVALYNLDLLILSARFPGAVGDYGALTVAGKFILFAGILISEPYIGIRARAGRRAFGVMVGACLLAWAPLLTIFAAAPSEIVSLLVGPRHLGLAHALAQYAWFAAASGLVYALFLEGMLTDRQGRTGLALLLAVGIQVFLLGVVADSVDAFLTLLPWTGGMAILIVGVASLTPSSLASFILHKREGHAHATA